MGPVLDGVERTIAMSLRTDEAPPLLDMESLWVLEPRRNRKWLLMLWWMVQQERMERFEAGEYACTS